MNQNKAIQIIWDFCVQRDNLSPADFLLVLGTREISHANHAASLYKLGLAKKVAVTGGNAKGTLDDHFTESARMKAVLLNHHVPNEVIIMENKSANTGENFLFSKKVIADKVVHRGIIVAKPYMTKRALATAKKVWSEIQWQVTAQDISLDEYLSVDPDCINAMVGDCERIIKYPEIGFQVEMPYQSEIIEAICVLRKAGYTKYALEYDFCAN